MIVWKLYRQVVLFAISDFFNKDMLKLKSFCQINFFLLDLLYLKVVLLLILLKQIYWLQQSHRHGRFLSKNVGHKPTEVHLKKPTFFFLQITLLLHLLSISNHLHSVLPKP